MLRDHMLGFVAPMTFKGTLIKEEKKNTYSRSVTTHKNNVISFVSPKAFDISITILDEAYESFQTIHEQAYEKLVRSLYRNSKEISAIEVGDTVELTETINVCFTCTKEGAQVQVEKIIDMDGTKGYHVSGGHGIFTFDIEATKVKLFQKGSK